MKIFPAAFAAGLLLSMSARADIGVTSDLSSAGVGAHLVAPLTPTLNARVGLNTLRHNASNTAGNLGYATKTTLQTADVLVDWYVKKDSSFRLTGGLVYNGNKVDARAHPDASGMYTINGRQYSSTDVGTLTGRVDYRKVAPYLGIGWGNALSTKSRWQFGIDIGAFFQGRPRTSLVSTGCSASAALCQSLASDVEAERATFAGDIRSFKAYPVLRLTASYRF